MYWCPLTAVNSETQSLHTRLFACMSPIICQSVTSQLFRMDLSEHHRRPVSVLVLGMCPQYTLASIRIVSQTASEVSDLMNDDLGTLYNVQVGSCDKTHRINYRKGTKNGQRKTHKLFSPPVWMSRLSWSLCVNVPDMAKHYVQGPFPYSNCIIIRFRWLYHCNAVVKKLKRSFHTAI